jgi:hypothetical protein
VTTPYSTNTRQPGVGMIYVGLSRAIRAKHVHTRHQQSGSTRGCATPSARFCHRRGFPTTTLKIRALDFDRVLPAVAEG